MKLKLLLLFLSGSTFALFTIFSYTVAKEMWNQVDFDTTVKLQDRIPRRLDEPFSLFSILGSAEVTVVFVAIFMLYNLIKMRVLGVIAWSMIVPATVVEIFGKLVLYHPGTPFFLHRSVKIGTSLPSFYIHTNFSYPSGHMTRTIFIATVLLILTLVKVKNLLLKIIIISFILLFVLIMAVSRVYLGEHWLTDVIGGGLLGVAFALFGLFLIFFKEKFDTKNQVLQQ